jgi:hypothetical protein
VNHVFFSAFRGVDMRRFIKVTLVRLVVCCFFLQSTGLFAAEPASTADIAVDVSTVKTEILTGEVLVPKFDKLMQLDEEVKSLEKHLGDLGFRPVRAPGNFWGIKQTFEVKHEQYVESGIQTLCLHDYSKPGSKDAAAIGQLTLTVGERSETYTFALEAPGGKFDEATEYKVDSKLNVLKAHSWWRCFRGKLLGCGGACAGALVTCSGTWSAYLGCVALACGGCFAKASLCCGCNCSWWCRWAVGCCHR